MISVIVCSRNDPSWNRHSNNVAQTIGSSHEYVRIDNRAGQYGICAAYNKGVDTSKGDILVFVHEDVLFLMKDWGKLLESKFAADPSIGIVGIAGGQVLHQDRPGWCVAGRPFIHGKVIHEVNGRLLLSAYSWIETDVEVVAVDGLFFAVRRSLFDRIRFDEETFDGFHFYDLDICMQALKTHKIIVTEDILVKHLSGGSFDRVWEKYAYRFTEKHRESLPVNCTEIEPELNRNRGRFETIDLTKRFPEILNV